MRGNTFSQSSRAAAIVIVPVAILTACTAPSVEELNQQVPQGSTFTQKLAQDYAGFATYEEKQMYDSMSAEHFASKGLAALRGQEVQPEDPAEWSIRNEQMMSGLQDGRARLMKALAEGAAAKAPAAAARAQVSYDCWVEQSEEAWQYGDIAACHSGFLRAMNTVERQLASATQPAPQARPAPAPRQPATPTSYMVFFDWDRADITPQARSILRTAADNAQKSGTARITIVGHADRSGPVPYNDGLSQRRADAVARALAAEGVDRQDIRTSARGERDPLVQTQDGVREPQNRRVEIQFASPGGPTTSRPPSPGGQGRNL